MPLVKVCILICDFVRPDRHRLFDHLDLLLALWKGVILRFLWINFLFEGWLFWLRNLYHLYVRKKLLWYYWISLDLNKGLFLLIICDLGPLNLYLICLFISFLRIAKAMSSLRFIPICCFKCIDDILSRSLWRFHQIWYGLRILALYILLLRVFIAILVCSAGRLGKISHELGVFGILWDSSEQIHKVKGLSIRNRNVYWRFLFFVSELRRAGLLALMRIHLIGY